VKLLDQSVVRLSNFLTKVILIKILRLEKFNNFSFFWLINLFINFLYTSFIVNSLLIYL